MPIIWPVLSPSSLVLSSPTFPTVAACVCMWNIKYCSVLEQYSHLILWLSALTRRVWTPLKCLGGLFHWLSPWHLFSKGIDEVYELVIFFVELLYPWFCMFNQYLVPRSTPYPGYEASSQWYLVVEVIKKSKALSKTVKVPTITVTYHEMGHLLILLDKTIYLSSGLYTVAIAMAALAHSGKYCKH